MTTEPNAVVEPIHEKAMPVMLMTPDDVEQWLRGVSVDDALKMQKPAPDDAIVIRPEEKKAAERQVGNVKNNRPELMERVGLL
jgi:putative SOS response-associated peptidase YedK